MKWEKPSRDDAVMMASAAGAAMCGLHALASPKTYQDMNLGASGTRSDDLTRWAGHATTIASAMMLGNTYNRMTDKGMKDMHKIAGVAWASVAAHQGYDISKNIMKKDPVNYGQVALGAGLAGLHLWRGFRKDKEDKPKAATTKK